MSELIEYLGEDGIQEIQLGIKDDVDKFKIQSDKTKLALVNQIKFDASIYKAASLKLIDCLDMTAAELDISEQKRKLAEDEIKKQGILNQEYIDQQSKLTVVVTDERKHAKKKLREMLDKDKFKKIKK